MATHRSLNKLEFKAHMSIHNMTDVPEGESHDSDFTRDRFGRNHRLSDNDGTSRITRRRRPKLSVILLLASLGVCGASVASPGTERGPNVSVESDSIEDYWSRSKHEKREPAFGIVVDEDTAIGINEDGDPNLSMKY